MNENPTAFPESASSACGACGAFRPAGDACSSCGVPGARPLVDPGRLSDADLVAFAQVQERAVRLAEHQAVQIADEIARRSTRELGKDGLAYAHGHARPTLFVQELTGVSGATANRRIRQGGRLRARQSWLGEELSATFPFVREAVEEGLIGQDQAEAITRALDTARPRADATALLMGEAWLTSSAVGGGWRPSRAGFSLDDPVFAQLQDAFENTSEDPMPADLLSVQATLFRDALDPDGVAPRHDRRYAQRGFRMLTRGGQWVLELTLDDEGEAIIRSLIEAEKEAYKRQSEEDETADADADAADAGGARPDASAGSQAGTGAGTATGTNATGTTCETERETTIKTGTGTGTGEAPGKPGSPSTNTSPDERSYPQFAYDVFVGMLKRFIGAGLTATLGGYEPVLSVIADNDQLDEPDGIAGIEGTDQTVPADFARQIVCTGRIRSIVMDKTTGEPLHLSRTSRLFTKHQKHAIAARDKKCAVPGCHARVAVTEVHHIDWWSHGGKTDIGNAILLCPFHHAQVHNGLRFVIERDGRPVVTRQNTPQRTNQRTNLRR